MRFAPTRRIRHSMGPLQTYTNNTKSTKTNPGNGTDNLLRTETISVPAGYDYIIIQGIQLAVGCDAQYTSGAAASVQGGFRVQGVDASTQWIAVDGITASNPTVTDCTTNSLNLGSLARVNVMPDGNVSVDIRGIYNKGSGVNACTALCVANVQITYIPVRRAHHGRF